MPATASIEDLFKAHRGLVFGYLLRRTGDPALAEDLLQETFARATRALLGWRGGSAAAWLLAIARHALADQVRRGRRLVPLEEGLVPASSSDAADDAAVRDALRRISPTEARLLVLVHVDGFTHAEVAAMTGTTPGAVKTAVWRAREAFRRAYADQGEHDERS